MDEIRPAWWPRECWVEGYPCRAHGLAYRHHKPGQPSRPRTIEVTVPIESIHVDGSEDENAEVNPALIAEEDERILEELEKESASE